MVINVLILLTPIVEIRLRSGLLTIKPIHLQITIDQNLLLKYLCCDRQESSINVLSNALILIHQHIIKSIYDNNDSIKIDLIYQIGYPTIPVSIELRWNNPSRTIIEDKLIKQISLLPVIADADTHNRLNSVDLVKYTIQEIYECIQRELESDSYTSFYIDTQAINYHTGNNPNSSSLMITEKNQTIEQIRVFKKIIFIVVESVVQSYSLI